MNQGSPAQGPRKAVVLIAILMIVAGLGILVLPPEYQAYVDPKTPVGKFADLLLLIVLGGGWLLAARRRR